MSLSAYYVPETMSNTVNLSLNPHNNPWVGLILIPILQKRTLKPSEVKWFAQLHTAIKWRRQNPNAGI